MCHIFIPVFSFGWFLFTGLDPSYRMGITMGKTWQSTLCRRSNSSWAIWFLRKEVLDDHCHLLPIGIVGKAITVCCLERKLSDCSKLICCPGNKATIYSPEILLVPGNGKNSWFGIASVILASLCYRLFAPTINKRLSKTVSRLSLVWLIPVEHLFSDGNH